MKDRVLILIFLAGLVMTYSQCTKENSRETLDPEPIDFDTLVFEHSMKGWELYSWPNGADWNYAVLPGTNVLKDCESVKYQPLVVTGEEDLKQLLSRMPAGEEIAWISEHWLEKIWTTEYEDLMLPPENIVTEMDRFCQERSLILMIAY